MAVKKSSGETKIQDVSASKKAGGKKSAAKKETAPQKSTTTSATTAAKTKSKSSSASTSASASPKKAAPKKAAAPIKLTTTQADLLKKISGSTEPGYRSEKKAEQRTIEALQERKLVKRGSKDKASGTYHYSLSNAGKKHLDATNMPAEKKAD